MKIKLAPEQTKESITIEKSVLTCPSVLGGDDVMTFTTNPCQGTACVLNTAGHCMAGASTAESYRQHFGGPWKIPECPISHKCMWNIESQRLGEQACAPRMLGLICEHQKDNESQNGVAIWNTFEMEPPGSTVWDQTNDGDDDATS